MIKWLMAIWQVITEEDPTVRVPTLEEKEAMGEAAIRDSAQRFYYHQCAAERAESRTAAQALNTTLWRIVGDYRAGCVPLSVAERAWKWEVNRAREMATWKALGIKPIRFCAALDENEKVS